MGKQRKQRQQPSKKKVQVKQKIAKQDSASTAPAKKLGDGKVPEDAKHIRVYGLSNLGNTCFYNSALQALVSVPKLRDFCLEPAGSHQLRKGPIGSALQELVQTVYGQKEMSEVQSVKVSKVSERAGNPVFSPSRLLAAICKVAPQFKGGQQQDSHEVLVKLIEGMLAEELRAVKALQDQESDSDDAAASMTEALFGGALSSQVVCDECGHKAVTQEPFYNLSLPVPSKLRGDASAQAPTKRRLKRITKKEGGGGKASVELPDKSPAAQEQAKLASKQNQTKGDKEKTGKLGKKRQQKQAAAARTGTEGHVAAESYRELSPILADSSPATFGSPGKTVGSANRELTPAKAAGTGSVGPTGQLLGGCEGSDSGASSDTSLAAGFADEQGHQAAGLGGNWEPLADTACTRVDAPVAPRAELALPSSSQYPGAPAAAPQHPSALPGRGHPRELNPMDGITSASLPAQNLHSDTCISRDADTLTMNAGENTEFPEGEAAMQACHPLLASGQPSSRGRPVRRRRQRRSPRQMAEASTAGPAPDAKSAAAPSGAAHSCPSTEDEEETSRLASQTGSRRRSEDSTRSVDSMMVRLVVRQDGNVSALSSEGSDETAPVQVTGRLGQGEPSMRLSGGSGGTGRDNSEGLNSSHASQASSYEGQDCSSRSSRDSETDPQEGSLVTGACSQRTAELRAGSGKDSLDTGLQQSNGSAAAADEHDAGSSGQGSGTAGRDLGRGQDEPAPELQREVSLGNTSVTSSMTNTDMALYEDLDGLRDEPSALGDLSSESEEDAAVAAERLQLGHFPVKAPSANAEEEAQIQPIEDGNKEEAQEDIAASPSAEDGALASDGEEADKEVTLEGCLAAFFAKEEVTWACPAEGKAASTARSGINQYQELSSCSPSVDVSTPDAREKFKRRSVSFSEEAPCVKYIPGSAEQRGTNFKLALSGERPFCRPLKHKEGYFLLTAEVDGENRESIFLGLQGQDESDETRETLESCNAIGGAIEFTSVAIDAIKDPTNEDEQARVMSQAQALLDCTADLVEHCGVLAAVDVLQEGLELHRSASWKSGHHSAEGWRITGKAPSKDGPAVWEYPPATSELGVSPRPKGDEVYVPREPLGKHQPSAADMGSPISTLKSRLGAYQQPIPEDKEGSTGSEASASAGSSLGEADARIRQALPDGVAGRTEPQQAADGEGPDLTGRVEAMSTKSNSKPASALSAALSEGSAASGSERGLPAASADGLEQRHSAASQTEPSAGLQDVAGEKDGQHGHSAPRSIPGSGCRVGRAPQLRAQHSAGLSASPSAVNSSTGTALFWTGSQALGIAFADSSERQHSESPGKKPEGAAVLADGDSNAARSPLETKALAHGLAFEDSADSGATSHFSHDNDSTAVVNGHSGGPFLERSSSAADAPAKEALAERADEDIRQRGISDLAAAAVAEVDAERAHEGGERRRFQPAGASLSGELPPGEQLIARGSMEEEREALSVSPDLKHLKSVPELARASPEAARPGAPLSVSPITLSPVPGPRSHSLPERSPAADATPLPSRQASGRSNSVERLTRSILRNKIAGPIKRKAVKGYLVHRAPEVLTLHLKRFQQDLSGSLRKINGPVPFPQQLDLSPFCAAEGEDARGAQYTLVGVVEHQGSMAGGHYISYSARLPAWQPTPPSTAGQKTETSPQINGPAAAAASRKAAASGKSAQNGPAANGREGEKAAAGAGTCDAADQDWAGRALAQLQESLAARREKLDAQKLLWFKASDAHVKAVSWEQVAACEPYLLMYVRS